MNINTHTHTLILSDLQSRSLQVDFDEEFTAMSGPGLAQQVMFVSKCVAFILSKYSVMAEKAPKSVILVGHSMGGLVAR